MDSPFHTLRFVVDFHEEPLGAEQPGREKAICQGSFSEVTGLEATMQPKEIKEGGRNYGSAQRMGPITFGTVILKRGLTDNRDLWQWFALLPGGQYATRLTAQISLTDASGRVTWTWRLRRCLPVKFKAAELKATGNEVGIEELHLAHEGLELLPGGAP